MRHLEEEDLRWLTVRGAHLPDGTSYNGQCNRPILLWNHGKSITMKEARTGGFHVQAVYESSDLIDASKVENATKCMFQHLPLGTHRLWRCVAEGQSAKKSDVD